MATSAVQLLNAKGLKYAAAGESLGTQILFANQELNIKGEQTIIEDFSMQNPASPTARYAVGTLTTITGVLQSHDLEELDEIMGGTTTTGVYVENATDVRTLPLQDIEIEIYNTSGTAKTVGITNVHFIPNHEMKVVADSRVYLPFEIRTTASSVKTITVT